MAVLQHRDILEQIQETAGLQPCDQPDQEDQTEELDVKRQEILLRIGPLQFSHVMGSGGFGAIK